MKRLVHLKLNSDILYHEQVLCGVKVAEYSVALLRQPYIHPSVHSHPSIPTNDIDLICAPGVVPVM